MKRNKENKSASYSFDEIAVWRTKLPKAKFAVLPPSNNRPNPLVTEDIVYVSVLSPGAVCALERKTGKLIWHRNIPRFGGSAVHLAQGKLFAQTATTIHALEPETGKTLWSFCPWGDSGETVYSQPTAYRDRVFVGDRGGFLYCLDSQTGEIRWKILTSRAKNRDVNSTPVVANGLVIVGTNAKMAAAYAIKTGTRVWVSRLDWPSHFGPLLCGDLLAVFTRSIYLLKPKTGKLVRRFSWKSDLVMAAEGSRRDIIVINDNWPPDGNVKLVRLNEHGIRFMEECHASCASVRYAPETELIYLSHLGGIEVRRRGDGTLAFRIERKCRAGENGLVDVKHNTIYVLTGDGYVYALRHPSA